MVGHRRSPSAEMLFPLSSPSVQGLLQFCRVWGPDWNISLFHYRNHGSAWGRVLLVLMQAAKTKEHRITSSALANVFGPKKRIPPTNCSCAEV